MATQESPFIEPTKEVRFSVVMYGGVSLAIYINGVAQELFHMARATAAVQPNDNGDASAISGKTIKSTERVYRKLAYLLADEHLLDDYQDYAKLLEELSQKAQASTTDPGEQKDRFKKLLETARPDPLEERTNDEASIATRFIVDILSGTSAGGINAIYLAKAFANNQPIDQLKDLWINEGDIGLLLNDKDSVLGTGLLNQLPPQSLLNSRRMYAKLLKSLNDMETDIKSPDSFFKSPFVDELDLFITATDIEGVPVPLRLSDAVVFERRHRNVFHFKYGKEEVIGSNFNDFTSNFNPFLAFAARCTSSFPFAFEPMRLRDMDEVLDIFGGAQKTCQSDSEVWQRFFQEELDPKTGEAVKPPRFAHRSFGDGGYLDNKPFSYATETLIQRQSEVPVDRKLIYVEPSPEHPEDQPGLLQKPNALQNVKAAVLELPTYETIREDLQRILERNQLIARVNRIISGIEQDVNNYIPSAVKSDTPWTPAVGTGSGQLNLKQPVESDNSQVSGQDWSTRDLADMVVTFGRYILPYRRLRVSSVTDDIAKLVARLTNFDEDSDQFLAIRCLVRAWREENYVDYRRTPEDQTVNGFLYKFDLGYRLRRLNFTRAKVDQLTRLDKTLVSELKGYRKSLEAIQAAGNIHDWAATSSKHGQIKLLLFGDQVASVITNPPDDFKDVLRFIKCELNEVFKQLRTRARLLRTRRAQTAGAAADNPLLAHLAKLDIRPQDLNRILGMDQENGTAVKSDNQQQDEEDCFVRAREVLSKNQQSKESLIATADELAKGLGAAFDFARTQCRPLFDIDSSPVPISDTGKDLLKRHPDLLKSNMAKSIRGFLGYYFHNFDDYDQISFPIFYETNVGEADVIEVIRISPEDATSLINEREELRNSPDPSKARQKLAGVALHHFGAFLDRVWRQNDIMWGRLDGAERLITALLPDKQYKQTRALLIREAHLSILKEELKPESIRALQSMIAESLLAAGTGIPISVAIEKTLGPLKDSPQKRQLERIISLSIEDDDLLEFMRKGYQVNRQLDTKAMLKTISRSTQIIGKMFEQLANANGLEGKRLGWIAQLGKLFWGLVEVAVPNSILNKMATHWLYLLYMFEVVVILGGIFLARPGAQQFGWTALGITALLNVVMLVLKDKMRARNPVQSLGALIVGSILVVLLLIGALKVVGVLGLTVDGERSPLNWISHLAMMVIDKVGPFREYLPYLLVLALVLLIIIVLNAAGSRTLSWFAKLSGSGVTREKFKKIKLARFKKRDMAFVRVSEDGAKVSYTVLSRLSSAPPPNWIQQFDENWKEHDANNQVRVYTDVLSFNAGKEDIAGVWRKLEATVSKTNQDYAKKLAQQNDELVKLQKEQLARQQKDLQDKWNSFKNLS